MLTNGHAVWAFRRACDTRPPALYDRDQPGGLRLPSEPIDEDQTGWQEVPRGDTLVLAPGQPVRVVMAGGEMARAA